jgi:hypothetical protein
MTDKDEQRSTELLRIGRKLYRLAKQVDPNDPELPMMESTLNTLEEALKGLKSVKADIAKEESQGKAQKRPRPHRVAPSD